MAFCTKCGSKVAEGLKFCPECGTPVGATPAADPTQQSTTPPTDTAPPVGYPPPAGAAPGYPPVAPVPGPPKININNVKNGALDFVDTLTNVPPYPKALGLALVGMLLMLAFLFAPVVNNRTDIMGMFGGGGEELSQNMQIFSTRTIYRSLIVLQRNMIDDFIEDQIDRWDLTRSEARDLRSDTMDEFRNDFGPIITASRVYGFLSILSILTIIAVIAAAYLLIIQHHYGMLAGFIAVGLGALTVIAAIIGAPVVQAAISDHRMWRDVYSVGHSFWIWIALVASALSVFLMYNLYKTNGKY